MKFLAFSSLVLVVFSCATDAFIIGPQKLASVASRSTTRSTPVRVVAVPVALHAGSSEDDNKWISFGESPLRSLGAVVLSAFLMWNILPPPVMAASSQVIGELKGSGLVFKDTLQIERFEDPKVKGITLYISNFERPLTEKLSGNFFNDPSSASVGCAKTGPISIADNIAKGKAGEEVFEESRSLLFKTLRVQRIYDEEEKAMVYVSFNTRLDKNDDANKSRFKSSLCAVGLE
jgi:catabolite regulation protein CreA